MSLRLTSLLCLFLFSGAGTAMAQAQPQLPAVGSGHPAVQRPSVDILTQFDTLASKLMAGDAKGALAEVRDILDRADFSSASLDIRYRSYLVAGMLEGELGSPEVAMQHLIAAGEVGPELREGTYWQPFTQTAADIKDYQAAATGMAAIAEQYPELLDHWNERFVTRILREAKKLDDPSTQRGVLEALFNSGYTPGSGYTSLEPFWLDLIDIYIGEGDDDRAAAVAATLTQPVGVSALGFDGRLAKFAPTNIEVVFREAMEARVRKVEGLITTYPRDARAVGSLANILAEFNRLPAALALLDNAIARVDAADGRPAFDDEEDYLEWLHNARTRVLMKLGRWDEAVAAQVRSRDIAHSYDPGSVSQSINLGDLYYLLGEPAKALEAISDMDLEKANGYGVSAAKEVEACSYHQQGDASKAAAAVDYLVEHSDDNFSSAKLALLCTGDISRLAKLVIQRLEDASTRREMLRDLQSYLPLPHNTEIGRLMERGYDKLKWRPDVQEAVSAVGRILTWPVFEPGA